MDFLKNNKEKGFTFFELLIVIGLFVVITAMAVPVSFNFYKTKILDEETASVSGVLKRAQSNAISGKEDSDWGVYFEGKRYHFFKGSECGEGFIQTFEIPPNIDVGGMSCIIFERHTGRPQIVPEIN